MRISSDGSDNWGKIFFNVDVVSLIEGLYFPQNNLEIQTEMSFLSIRHYKYFW